MKHLLLSLYTIMFIFLGSACLEEKDQSNEQTHVATTTMSVTTNPSGARIFVNAKEIGVSPISIPIKADVSVTVSTQLNGYRRSNRVCNAIPNIENKVHFNLREITGSLAITTDPVGADVIIDGAPKGPSPVILSQLPPKSYAVMVKMPGFTSQSSNITVPADGAPAWGKFTLTSMMSTLSVDAVDGDDENEPIVGAKILINGKEIGVTPYKSEYPEGNYDLTVSAEGYIDVTRKVTLMRNNSYKEKFDLLQKPGVINIQSSPAGANVYINNQLAGITPHVANELKPGAYKIEVELTGFDKESKTIILSKGAKLSHNFTLISNQGGIDLDALPVGARVLVNGKFKGHIEASEGNPLEASRFEIRNLPSGSHEIELIHKKATPRTFKAKIDVEKGKISTKEIKLWMPNVSIQLNSGAIKEGLLIKKDNNSITYEPQRGVRKVYSSSEYSKITPIVIKDN